MMTENPNLHRGPWCMVCAAEKNRDNHWFKIAYEDGGIIFMELADPRPGDPICGEVCAHKKLSEWLGAKREIFERLRVRLTQSIKA